MSEDGKQKHGKWYFSYTYVTLKNFGAIGMSQDDAEKEIELEALNEEDANAEAHGIWEIMGELIEKKDYEKLRPYLPIMAMPGGSFKGACVHFRVYPVWATRKLSE
ncbi:hypothetical protein ACFLZC_01485 [Patescibacteria group bacterium]